MYYVIGSVLGVCYADSQCRRNFKEYYLRFPLSLDDSSMDVEDEELVQQIKRHQRERMHASESKVGPLHRCVHSLTPTQIALGGGDPDYDLSQYDSSIAVNDDEEQHEVRLGRRQLADSYTAPKHLLDEIPKDKDADDVFRDTRRKTIAEREDDYHQRRQHLMRLSPARADMFSDKTPAADMRKPADALKEAQLEREEAELRRKLELKKREKEKEDQRKKDGEKKDKERDRRDDRDRRDRDDRDRRDRDDRDRRDRDDRDRRDRDRDRERDRRDRDRDRDRDRRDRDRDNRDRDRDRDRRDRRDRDGDRKEKKSEWDEKPSSSQWDATPSSKWDQTPSASTPSRWDQTPAGNATPSRWDQTPASSTPSRKRSRWDATPTGTPSSSRWDQTPAGATPGRWDETPAGEGMDTPKRGGSRWDETPAQTPGSATPFGGAGLATPMPAGAMTPEAMVAARFQYEMDYRNRYLTDNELDEMFPDGYEIVKPPANYVPIRTPARKLMATPTPMGNNEFMMQSESNMINPAEFGVTVQLPGDLPEIKPEDAKYFAFILDGRDENTLTPEEAKINKVLKLLLKVKNGTPPQRKQALRMLTDKAREFGPAILFDNILPLLMSPTLEDQERHLLVKVIDRVLYKLDDLVRPYVHKILVVIEPLLIDEDYYARVEGREIISNLAKAAGLATMIAVMRPDIDNNDEYVRNTTARAFAVVASALGIPALLPFLKAVCQSKSAWQARHTGIKIVQQIAILMGCAILPHLKGLVSIIEHGLKDTEHKVRTITALAIAALAEASAPYGIESFDSVLKPLWYGIKVHRGKGLAAFLKAIGYIIPLMDAEYASYYTTEVMIILIKEFASPDEEMKKIVLKVVKQCVSTEGVEAKYIRREILEPFFKHFWVRRMAMDRRNYRQLVDTTVELANKVGAAEIIGRVVKDLQDDSEAYRKMVCETIDLVITNVGASDIDARLEELLLDGILYAFQEQASDDANAVLNAFGTILTSMGKRARPFIPQIANVIRFHLGSKLPKVRQRAADLITRIAVVMKTCGEEKYLGHLGRFLYEYLGEEYPEVLGSILGALKAIVNVIGMEKMDPPIKDLLPSLTPVLKNRHEKVQENCIDLVGRIADRGYEFVTAKEWMRICFELLDMLKAHKKGIRRATVNTFGYIAKAIGPQEVLATLLNNLRVQERQNRVCTTVAIAIVAETCAPYTVLPALMNEYRVRELNVQNGVLKALSFLFEYISEMGKDYIYAVTPLLVDALMDRDLVHRQTACTVVKHLALGVYGMYLSFVVEPLTDTLPGLGCEDALMQLLNHVWPNVFEASPHVHNAFCEAADGLRVSLGPGIILNYVLQGLFHAARKVRTVYWKVYNNTYIGAQDAMVAVYPALSDDEHNTYYRAELNCFI